MRDLLEELVDRRDAGRREHLRAVGLRQREVTAAHCSATCAVYAAASMSASASDGSERRIRMSQPSPYGSSLTISGSSTAFWLISRTSPESGAMTSDTALTDSTSPAALSFATVAPISGGSKWTSSPSESCANHVIPSVASSPSMRAQSCSGWYLRSSG